jgi:hypothetical protein
MRFGSLVNASTPPVHERDIAAGTAMVLRVRAGIGPPDKGELRCQGIGQGLSRRIK